MGDWPAQLACHPTQAYLYYQCSTWGDNTVYLRARMRDGVTRNSLHVRDVTHHTARAWLHAQVSARTTVSRNDVYFTIFTLSLNSIILISAPPTCFHTCERVEWHDFILNMWSVVQYVLFINSLRPQKTLYYACDTLEYDLCKHDALSLTANDTARQENQAEDLINISSDIQYITTSAI